ncbi:hypothetical protein WS86_30640 [Burkholderia savannae]|nr:hypothetical protein WS86_30640 [Burkholderia savannae]
MLGENGSRTRQAGQYRRFLQILRRLGLHEDNRTIAANNLVVGRILKHLASLAVDKCSVLGTAKMQDLWAEFQ